MSNPEETKPKWKDQNIGVRLKAVEDMDDPEILIFLINNDCEEVIQLIAFNRIVSLGKLSNVIHDISNKNALLDMAKTYQNDEIALRAEVKDRLDEALNTLICKYYKNNDHQACAGLGIYAIRPLLAMMKADRISIYFASDMLGPSLRYAGIQALDAVEPLIQYYLTRDKTNRIIEAIGSIGSEKAIPFLLNELGNASNRNEDLVQEIISALGKIGSISSIDVIMKYARSDNDGTRVRVAYALRDIKDACVDKYLIDLSKDKNQYVREAAEKALSERGYFIFDKEGRLYADYYYGNSRSEAIWKKPNNSEKEYIVDEIAKAANDLGAYYGILNKEIDDMVRAKLAWKKH